MPRFAIRRLPTGPEELRAQLPITGHTVDRRTDPYGNGEYFYARLDQRLKCRFPPDSNAARSDQQNVDRDDRGPFLWVNAVIISASTPGQQLHVGMRDFAVDLAYVVDPLLADDSFMDPARVDYVGVAEIDDDVDAINGAAQVLPDLNGEPDTTLSTTSDEVAAPRFAPHDFQTVLDQMAATLTSLAGEHISREAVVPQRIESDTQPAEDTPTYSLGADALRYRTWDPLHGWVLRETTDSDELLYWILDDLASGIAWRWAQHAPAFADMDQHHALRTLWMPYWHVLVYALRPEWGRRTRESIRRLAAGNPTPRPIQDGTRHAPDRIPEIR